jgi:spore coat protein E
MSNYKEIVTKAVIGKGKKYFKNKYSVKSEVVPSTILGCWIINHLLVVGDNHCKIY